MLCALVAFARCELVGRLGRGEPNAERCNQAEEGFGHGPYCGPLGLFVLLFRANRLLVSAKARVTGLQAEGLFADGRGRRVTVKTRG
jgi:hypothetical protein